MQRVHRVLLSLQKWDDELPQSLVLRQANLPRNVTSLHLHYNQCVISTTRPILLYLFKTRFSLNFITTEVAPRTFSSTTLALAESCVQAAKASNSILSRCFVEGTLASFGYLDAHYLFSSTLVLIMSAVMDPNVIMSDAVLYAFTIMKAMKEDGNLPSCDYYERLQRTKVSVGKLKEACDAQVRSLMVPEYNHQSRNIQPCEVVDNQELGFGEGLPLNHPLIHNFLADQGSWANGMLPEDHFLRDLACDLDDEFLFGGQQ